MTSIAAVGFLGACGGNVSVTTGGGGGGDGGNGNGGAGAGGAAEGGGSSTTTTTNTGGGGGTAECNGLGHISCLAAYPSCVPVYDDLCCPMCDPMGGCADCVNVQFHHCADLGASCDGTADPCGVIAPLNCKGAPTSCADIDPGGSTAPCASAVGCVPAYCPVDQDCTTDPVCHAAAAGTCTVQCDAPSPACPDGTVPEGDGFCYTGFCVPQELCAITVDGG